MNAPTPRPAQGFTSSRAQSWVLGSAMITALIYGFRRTVEGATPSTVQKGKVNSLLGSGTPAPLNQWLIAYGAAYLMLAVLALGAPELAASLAMMAVIGNVITNGLTITGDLAALEAGGTPAQQSAAANAAGKAAPAIPAPTITKTSIPQPAPFPTGGQG